ncbi:hypothetical protein GCM10023314_06370 [Algibacter agarivorans]|uniref:Anti-sigma factor n=1 Tax=Algibacter agarivorans TaxID=1109741 RepID=A0ABP9GBH0_9FLAO
MAPIKFEEHIKEKLDKRSLKPSADAWNILSKRLDNQDKNNKTYWWIGIAASIIGVLLVVSQFLNNDVVFEEIPKIVVTPEVVQQEETIKIISEHIGEKGLNTIEKVNNIDKAETIEKSKPEKLVNKNRIKGTVTKVVEGKTNSKEKDIQMGLIELPKENLTFEDQRIQNIVAQVQALKADNKNVTDEDIDALLIEAQKEIRLNKLINETTGVVDADYLLQDVEAELDKSFRSKVFEALRSSYNSVKTAVAQRND